MDSKRNGEAGIYNMSLKNVLIVVDNIDESIDFYEELFGLRVITRLEGNVIMSEGLVLQDVDVWYDSTKIHTTPHNNMTELYFEDNDIEGIIEKLESGKYVVSYVIERYYDIHNASCFNYFSCFERNDELSEHYAEGLKFWKKEYEDFSFSSPKVNGYSDKEYDRHSILLPKKEIDGVTEKSKIAYLLLLFYLSLQECNLQNSDEFVIGIPYTNRTNAIQAGTQGFFVNMMPARLKLIGMSFEAQIKYLLDYLEKMSMYQDIPYEDIINGISFNDYKEKKEFLRFAFVYQSEMSLRSFDEGESIKMKEYHLGIPMFDMTIYINDTENFYEVMLETNNMINNETINFFFERFTSLYNNLSETQNLMLVDETINSI